MYYEMYPISHFISERQKKIQPSNRKAFRIKKNIWQAVGVLTTPGGTQLELSRDNRSINKLPSMSPTTELEENSKLCNLKEQKKSKGQPGGSHGLALGSLEELLPSKATERKMAGDIPAQHVGHNKDTSLP